MFFYEIWVIRIKEKRREIIKRKEVSGYQKKNEIKKSNGVSDLKSLVWNSVIWILLD